MAAAVCLAALACGSGRDPEDCTTLDCREQAVLRAWASEPGAGMVMVLQVEDPVEQLALVERLAHAIPGRLGPLCAQLPPGSAAAERCAQTASRPHLGRRDAVPPDAAGPPLPGLEVALPRPPRPPGTLELGVCSGAPSRDSCLRRRAEKAVRTGAIGDGIALCHADGDGLQADECVFRLAERMLQQPPERVPLAVVQDLCLQAGELAENCLGHVVLAAARSAPAADHTAAADWAPALAVRERLLASWAAPEAAAVRAELEDLFWAEATRHAVAGASQLTGAAAAVLPAGARPHLRCALAAAVLQEAEPGAALDALGARLDAVMTGPPQPRTRQALPLRRAPLPAPVVADPPAGGLSPTRRHMMGLSRRWSVEDPAADGAVCLVEAAARLEPPRVEVVTAGLASPVGVVQATAARLAPAVSPGDRPR